MGQAAALREIKRFLESLILQNWTTQEEYSRCYSGPMLQELNAIPISIVSSIIAYSLHKMRYLKKMPPAHLLVTPNNKIYTGRVAQLVADIQASIFSNSV